MFGSRNLLFNSFFLICVVGTVTPRIDHSLSVKLYSKTSESNRLKIFLRKGSTNHVGAFFWKVNFAKCNLFKLKKPRITYKSHLIAPSNMYKPIPKRIKNRVLNHELLHVRNFQFFKLNFYPLILGSCFMSDAFFKSSYKAILKTAVTQDVYLDLKTKHGIL